MSSLRLVTDATPRRQREFLPAALEVVESPPNPAGRALAWLLMGLFTVIVVWACIGKVDIVAVARGKVVPAGQVKTIQPLEIGSVRAIHVREGQQVAAGELLIEMDPTGSDADEARLRRELDGAVAAAARIEALLAWAQSFDVAPPTGASTKLDLPSTVPAGIALAEQRLFESQRAEQSAQSRMLSAAVTQAEAERAGLTEQIAKLQAILPLVTERAQAVRTLAGKKLMARTEYLALEQERISHRQDLAALVRRAAQADEAVEQARAEQVRSASTFHAALLREQSEVEQRRHALEAELAKAAKRAALHRLTAPVDGTVQQLAVHTVGGVVTPAQELMVIVPAEGGLHVEAFFENKDIGFIAEGQPAAVKVDAFPFTTFGTLESELAAVSRDAVEQQGIGWVFPARLELPARADEEKLHAMRLTPGMAVSAEVTTGQRRIIEFVLAPVLKALGESGRER